MCKFKEKLLKKMGQSTFITNDDTLPKIICSVCCQQLTDAYRFCMKCRAANEKLLTQYRLSDLEEKGVHDEEEEQQLPDKIVDDLIELPGAEPKDQNEILVDLMMRREEELFDEIIEEDHFSDDESFEDNVDLMAGNLSAEVVNLESDPLFNEEIKVPTVLECMNFDNRAAKDHRVEEGTLDDEPVSVIQNAQVNSNLKESENLLNQREIEETIPHEDSPASEMVLLNNLSNVEEMPFEAKRFEQMVFFVKPQVVEGLFDQEGTKNTEERLETDFEKIPLSKRTGPLQALPPEELIVEREDHGDYQSIYYSGTACCGCNQYFLSLEALEEHCQKQHRLGDPPGEFFCPLCYKKFHGLKHQLRHSNQRVIPQLFHCKLCQYVCREQVAIDRHMESSVIHNKPMMAFAQVMEAFDVVPVKGVLCCDCYLMFPDRSQMEEHAQVHYQDRLDSKEKALLTFVNWCETCHQVFRVNHKYELHRNTSVIEAIYRCKHDFCNYRTPSIVFARFHLRSKDHEALDSDGYKKKVENSTKGLSDRRCCFRKCLQMFNSKLALLAHVEQVHQAKQLENELRRKKSTNVCSLCNCNFGSRRALKQHRQPKSKDFVCEKCGLAVGSSFQLQYHVKQVHNNIRVQRDFKCEECPRAFVSAVNLRRHKQQDHDKPNDNACTVCEKQFKTKEGLWNHWRTHNDKVEKFECDTCKKAGKRYMFRDLKTLNRHYKISEMHGGIRKHNCTHEGCTNSYAHKPDLVRHELMVHQGIRPFVCKVCQKGFIRTRDLRLHERTHTGAKLYNCETCSATFNVYQEYKKHCSDEHGISVLINYVPKSSK